MTRILEVALSWNPPEMGTLASLTAAGMHRIDEPSQMNIGAPSICWSTVMPCWRLDPMVVIRR
jgi:hypothetical protein